MIPLGTTAARSAWAPIITIPRKRPRMRSRSTVSWIDPTPVTNAQFVASSKRAAMSRRAEIPPTSTRPRPAACPPIRASHRRRGRPDRARRSHSAQGIEGSLRSLRAKLLPALPAGSTPCRTDRYVDQPCWFPLRRQDAARTMTPNWVLVTSRMARNKQTDDASKGVACRYLVVSGLSDANSRSACARKPHGPSDDRSSVQDAGAAKG